MSARAHLSRETWGDKSEHERVHFWCPGCDDRHAVLVDDPANGWGWNGDLLGTFPARQKRLTRTVR